MTDRQVAQRKARRATTDKAMRAMILKGIAAAERVHLTKSGVTFFGPLGTASAHFTASDHRAVRNLEADLRRIGLL